MKKFAPLLALLALLSGGIAWYQWTSSGTLATSLQEATKERDTLRQRVADLERRERKLTDEIALLRDAPPPPPPSVLGPMTSGGRTMTFRSGGAMPGPMGALESPEMRRLMAVGQKGQLDTRYAALFRTLGLPAPQLEKLKQLLIDKQNVALDVMAAARSQGLTGPDSRGQIQTLMQQANSEMDSSIKGLLGDSGYQQYQQFERTQAQRGVVDQLASRLSYSDSPLTPQQAEQLVQLLASTAPAAPTGGGPGGSVTLSANTMMFSASVSGPAGASGSGPNPGTMISIMGGNNGAQITPEAVAQAQNLLTPTQLAALQQLQSEQQAQQQMSQLMRQSIESQGVHFSGPDSGPPPPPPVSGG